MQEVNQLILGTETLFRIHILLGTLFSTMNSASFHTRVHALTMFDAVTHQYKGEPLDLISQNLQNQAKD